MENLEQIDVNYEWIDGCKSRHKLIRVFKSKYLNWEQRLGNLCAPSLLQISSEMYHKVCLIGRQECVPNLHI